MIQYRLWSVLFVFLMSCVPGERPRLDLDSPGLVWTSITPGAVSTTAPILLVFDQPLDPGTVTGDTVQAVPFASAGSCAIDHACGTGPCYRGSCQTDRVDEGWITDMLTPPLGAWRRALAAPAGVSLDPTGTRVTLQPAAPLSPHRLHRLIVSPRITDMNGNPAVAASGQRLVLSRRFATADAASGRPTAWLRSPVTHANSLPTNLASVIVMFSEPVLNVDGGSLWLSSVAGQRVRAVVRRDAAVCLGRAKDTCFELEILTSLSSLSVFRLEVSPRVVDRQGQRVMPIRSQDFSTGAAADHAAPACSQLRVQAADGCVVVRTRTDEDATLTVTGAWGGTFTGGAGQRDHELHLKAPASQAAQALRVTMEDLAGNKKTITVPSMDLSPRPRVVISEVLANPAGPEPAQEFVELRNLESTPVNLGGWILDDEDDGSGADVLPPMTLLPGQYLVVVGKGYSTAAAADAAPPSGTLMIHLKTAIGAGGLANASERLVLRDASGRLVSAYGAHFQVNKAADNGRSVERRHIGGCDLRSSWRPNPAGESTPGRPAKLEGK